MAKKNKNVYQQKPPASNGNIPKIPGELIRGIISTVIQTSDSLGEEKPDWNEQLLSDLHIALPEERKGEYQALLTRFMEMGKKMQTAIIDAKLSGEEVAREKLKLDEEKLNSNDRNQTLEKKEQFILSEEVDLRQKEAEILAKEREIIEREANARIGFLKENNNAVQQLKNEISELEIKHLKLQSEFNSTRERELEKTKQETTKALANIEGRQLKADEFDAQLAAEKENLELQKRNFQRNQKSAEYLESTIRQQVKEDAAESLKWKESEIDRIKIQNSALATLLEKAKNQLDEYQEFEDELAGDPPAKILEELKVLRIQNRDKDDKIRLLESDKSKDDSKVLRSDLDSLEEELRNVRLENEEYKTQSHQFRIGVLEKERWSMDNRVMQKNNELLRSHLNELESRIQGLTEIQGNQSPFPELARMDTEFRFNTPVPVQSVGNLKAFTEELQHRIASSQPGNPLYFQLEDLQLFVGGFAMSHLHVLQGISGTGKTSLAKAFAKAVGGECTDIAIQAGWRDRADLLGHYNAFEKRFYEKDCLQALYKAQTPAFNDRINIILLDEMNLSRPEQYFADFLSALEKEPGDRRVPLMESAPANAPKLFREGREVLVPDNVWFIGTANQDETTNELADKTHDRAFVMELPRHEGQFPIKRNFEQASYQFQSLKDSFILAQKTDEKVVREALQFIAKSELTKVLEDCFGLGWGNRFERQALKFLPVVKAAGGSYELAIDHLLATRVFRAGKVTGRYDTDKDDLAAVQKALKKTLAGVFPNFEPSRCITAIEKDLKRLERGA